MIDYADKSFLRAPLPDTPQARAAAAVERMGRRCATHPRSTFVYNHNPVVLVDWLRRREALRAAKGKR